jgi:hypothetical protein
MKTFEIWTNQSNGWTKEGAQHIVEADMVVFQDGQYLFTDTLGTILHAVVAVPNLFIRSVRA